MDIDQTVREPLWASALLAAGDGWIHPALRRQIQWQCGRASLRLTNDGPHPVPIPELGIRLGAGSALDVRWPAGATAYEFELV